MGIGGELEADSAEGAGPPAKHGPGFWVALALGGFVLLGLCGVGAVALLFSAGVSRDKLRANELQCSLNLKSIGLGAGMYSELHSEDRRSFPFDPSDPTGRKAIDLLVATRCLRPEEVTCGFAHAGDFSYEGFPVKLSSDAPPGRAIAWDRRPHPDGTRCVVFVDAHVQEHVDEATFQQILAAARAPVR